MSVCSFTKLRLHPVLWQILVGFLLGCIPIQEGPERNFGELINSTEVIRLQFSPAMQPRIVMSIGSSISVDRSLELLRFNEVREELEIDASQERQLTRVLEYFEGEVKAVEELLVNDNQRAANERFYRAEQAYFSELGSVLLPFQLERLGQLGDRLLLQQLGVVKGLMRIANRRGVQLSNDEIQSITEALRLGRGDSLKASESIRKEFVEKVTGSLSVKTRSAIVDAYGSVVWDAPIEVLLAEARVAFLTDKDVESSASVDSLEDLVRNLRFYRLGVDGNWEVETPYSELSDAGVSVVLGSFLRSPGIARQLQLTESQNDQLEALVKKLVIQSRELNLEYRGLRQLEADIGPLGQSPSKTRAELVMELQRDFRSSLTKVISSSQLKELEKLIQLQVLATGGLISEIARGRVGNEIKLSEIERNSFANACRVQFEEARKRLTEEESKLLDKVLGELSDHKRDAMKDAIGHPPQLYVPSIFLVTSELEPNEPCYMDFD